MRPTTRAPQTLGLLALLATPGCCNLAAFFCGPDKSPWVPISYETHRAALATFMEAVRRDQPRVIYESLSPGYKNRMGIPGSFEAALAWEKIREQTPEAHMLGRAEVTGPQILAPQPPASGSPRHVRYVLEIGGQRVSVELARHSYAQVRYLSNGTEQLNDRYVPSLRPLVELDRLPAGDSAVVLRVPDAELPPGVTDRDILEVNGGHVWKVVDLRPLE